MVGKRKKSKRGRSRSSHGLLELIKTNKLYFTLAFLLVLWLASWLISSLFFGALTISQKNMTNVALIKIHGTILSEKSASFLPSSQAVSTEIAKLIEKADQDPGTGAIMVEINSPGGSAFATKEIADALKRSSKLKVCYIREVGASGGYWIASSCNKIYADQLSIIGSVGVIGSYLEFAGFLKNYNITYQRLVGGQYKDAGSPFKELTADEKELIQQRIDLLHQIFIREVKQNRNLDNEKIKEISQAAFYLGDQALDLGLIDQLGGRQEVEKYLEKELNKSIQIVEFKKSKGFWESLQEIYFQRGFFVGRGIGNSLLYPFESGLRTQIKINKD